MKKLLVTLSFLFLIMGMINSQAVRITLITLDNGTYTINYTITLPAAEQITNYRALLLIRNNEDERVRITHRTVTNPVLGQMGTNIVKGNNVCTYRGTMNDVRGDDTETVTFRIDLVRTTDNRTVSSQLYSMQWWDTIDPFIEPPPVWVLMAVHHPNFSMQIQGAQRVTSASSNTPELHIIVSVRNTQGSTIMQQSNTDAYTLTASVVENGVTHDSVFLTGPVEFSTFTPLSWTDPDFTVIGKSPAPPGGDAIPWEGPGVLEGRIKFKANALIPNITRLKNIVLKFNGLPSNVSLLTMPLNEGMLNPPVGQFPQKMGHAGLLFEIQYGVIKTIGAQKVIDFSILVENKTKGSLVFSPAVKPVRIEYTTVNNHNITDVIYSDQCSLTWDTPPLNPAAIPISSGFFITGHLIVNIVSNSTFSKINALYINFNKLETLIMGYKFPILEVRAN